MGGHHSNHRESGFLSGKRILPEPIRAGISAVELIDSAFMAYNGRQAARGLPALSRAGCSNRM